MTSLPSPARDWASSLTLHGIIAAIFLMLLRPLSLPLPATSRSWEVDLFTAPPPSAAPATQRPLAPEPPDPVARPAMPSRAPAAAPMPVPHAEAAEPAQTSAATAPASSAPTPVVSTAAPVAAAPANVANGSRTEATPTPAPPAVGEVHQRSWYASLVAKMQELKQYPLVARRRGQEGVVVIEASVRSDGSVDTSIKQSSGHDLLDRAALRLVGDALAALRGQAGQAPVGRLEIPVAYRLNE